MTSNSGNGKRWSQERAPEFTTWAATAEGKRPAMLAVAEVTFTPRQEQLAVVDAALRSLAKEPGS